MASSTALTRLSAALLADVLARNTLAADESMLLTAALRWAQAQVDALEVVAIPTTSPLLEALNATATAGSLAELAHTIPLSQAGQSVLFDGVASGSIHPLLGGMSSSSGSKLDHSAQQQAQTDSVARLGRRASQEHQHQHIHLSADMHVHGRGGEEIGTAAPGLEAGQQYGSASAVDAMGSSGLNEDRLPLTPAQHAVHGLEDAGQQANQVAAHLARENALAEVDHVMCLIR